MGGCWTHLIIGGPRAVSAALALEFSKVLPDGVDKTNAGSGLTCLELRHHTLVFDDDDDGEGSSVKALQRPRLLHSLVDGYAFLILCENPCAQCMIEVRRSTSAVALAC